MNVNGLGLILRKILTSSWDTLCGQAARLSIPRYPYVQKASTAESYAHNLKRSKNKNKSHANSIHSVECKREYGN